MPVLIDGYNLLFGLKSAPGDLKKERGDLIASLAGLLAKAKKEATVVFDSHSPKSPATKENVGSLEIIFTNEGEEADDHILRKIKSSKKPALFLVVTSDKKLAERARRCLAKTIGVREWIALTVKQAKKQELLEKRKEEGAPKTPTRPQRKEAPVPEKKRPLSEQEYLQEIFEERFKKMDVQEKSSEGKQSAARKKKRAPEKKKPQEKSYSSEEERWLTLFEEKIKRDY